MSRIGKLPITVPAGVEVKISDTNEITVKGRTAHFQDNFILI